MWFVQDHGRSHLLAQCRMRTTKRDRRRDRGMRQQNLIDFMRSDVLAATDDDVLDPAGQVQIAVCVKESFVASAKPSIHKSVSVGFGIVFISTKYIGSLNDDFAPMVGAEVIALLVHNADAQSGADSDRACFAMSRGQRIRGHLVGRFGHSVGFDEGHAKEPLDLVNELWATEERCRNG